MRALTRTYVEPRIVKRSMDGDVHWNLTRDLALDFMFRPSGTSGYDDLAATAICARLGAALVVTVADKERIVASKRAAARANDVAFLETSG